VVKGTTRFVAREILILIRTLEKEKLILVISNIISHMPTIKRDGTKI
jgi:hypothetical protein